MNLQLAVRELVAVHLRIYHGYQLNMRLIETCPIPGKPVPTSAKMYPLC